MRFEIFVFICKTRPNHYALTLDRQGRNLPSGECPEGWAYLKQICIESGSMWFIGLPPNQVIIDAIKKDGYFITGELNSTIK